METGNNDETPTNAPQPPPPLAADDDERSELLFESASEDEAAAATAAETPPREAVADIPNNLRDTLKSGRRDTAPARVTSTKRARKATSRFADLEARGQTYSRPVENDDDEVVSPPRPTPTRPAPPQPSSARQGEAPSDLPRVSQGHGDGGLNSETTQFADWARLRDVETEARRRVVGRIQESARSIWDGAVCEVYGSGFTDAAWFKSDLDIFVKPFGARYHVFQIDGVMSLGQALRRSSEFINVEELTRTRVPIVRCVHSSTGISVDVSFSKDKHEAPPAPFRSEYPDHSELLIALKAVLSSRGQHASLSGGLSSIRIALLLERYLQVLARASSPNPLLDVSRIEGFLMYITDSVGEGPLREGTRTISGVDFRIVKVREVKAAFSDALRTLRTTRSLSGTIRDYSSLQRCRDESMRRAQASVPFSGQGHVLGRGGGG